MCSALKHACIGTEQRLRLVMVESSSLEDTMKLSDPALHDDAWAKVLHSHHTPHTTHASAHVPPSHAFSAYNNCSCGVRTASWCPGASACAASRARSVLPLSASLPSSLPVAAPSLTSARPLPPCRAQVDAIRYAREHRVPFLGVCLGMQVDDTTHTQLQLLLLPSPPS